MARRWSPAGGWRDGAAQQGTDQLQPGFDLVFGTDAFAILLHGMDGDLQLPGNLHIGCPLQEQRQDFLFPWCEKLARTGDRSGFLHAQLGTFREEDFIVSCCQQRLHDFHLGAQEIVFAHDPRGAGFERQQTIAAIAGEHHDHLEIAHSLQGSTAEGKAGTFGELIAADEQPRLARTDAVQRLLFGGGDTLDELRIANRADES